jgi:gliding motility-associated-like protein
MNMDGCQHIDSLDLSIYPEINLTAIIADEICINDLNGSIVLSVSGGLGSFSYNWSGPSLFSDTTKDIFNLRPGIYILTITDLVSLCTKDTSFVIDQGFDMQVNITSNNINCYNANDGIIDITPLNLINPIYTWSDISNSLEDRVNMSPGIYFLQIEDNNCYLRDTFNFAQPDSLFIISQQTTSVCLNGNSGEISVQTFGGTPSYSYYWSNWLGNNPVNSNLSPGTYDLDIYDDNGCLFEETFIIASYQLDISSSITNINCYGDSTGSIDLTVNNGFFPYVYLWSDGTTNEDIYNLSQGSINCSIVDFFGCTITESFILVEETPIQTTVSINNVSCYGGNDGNASLNISGGVNPYSIDWYNIDENNLFEGTYLYAITDDNGCTYNDSIYISQEDSLDVSINVIDLSCPGDPQGEISIFINSGGVSPFVFSWTGPNAFNSSQQDINNLYSGLYTLTLNDLNGCSSEFQITLGEPSSLSQYINIEQSNYSSYNISCHEGNDGWISATPNGGYIPYSYLWSTGSTSSDINNLVAGTYNLTVTNGIGCQEDFILSINEPSQALTAIPISLYNYNGNDISCFGGSDGAIMVDVLGGVSPYSYFWNNEISFNPNISLSSGVYNLEVIDNNNCSYFEAIILDEPEALNWDIDIFSDTCELAVGKVDINLSGGITPYVYEWNYFDALPTANAVVEGEYFIKFIDANLCTAYDTIYVDNLIGPDIDFIILRDYEQLYKQLDDPIVFIDKTESGWQNVNSWMWDFGDNSLGYDSIGYHSYQNIGTYFVTLTIETDYNCIDTLTKKVVIAEYDIFIPNAFTPSPNDNLNEDFKPYGIGIDEFSMNIYTRWGEKIFSNSNIEDSWNGKYNNTNNDCTAGIYLYKITVKDIFGAIHKYEGQVLLIR